MRLPAILFLLLTGICIDLVQSATPKQLARWLGVREPPPTGVLVIDAGNVGRARGKALKDHGVKVVLTDGNWENTRLARMQGLEVYYGNPISEHADRHLDLSGIGRMVAASGQSNVDALACFRFRTEFGVSSVYELQSTRDQLLSEKRKEKEDIGEIPGQAAVREGRDLRKVRRLAAFRRGHPHDDAESGVRLQVVSVPVSGPGHTAFAIEPKGRLQMFAADQALAPGADWKIVRLIHPETPAPLQTWPPTAR